MSSLLAQCVAAFLALAALLTPQGVLAQAAEAAAIEDLALASRILANEGVLDAYGHVSIRTRAIRTAT